MCRNRAAGPAYADVGVALLAVAGNGGLVRSIGLCGAGAPDGDLGALGVELRGVGLVQRDELVSDQVVAGGEASRDGARPLLVAADELGDIPAGALLGIEEDAAGVVEAGLVDLEPAGPGAVAGREGAGALVHPHHDGALAVRPLLPHGRDLVARHDRRLLCSRPATVAAQIGIGTVRDGAVARPLPLDDLLGAGGVVGIIPITPS